jgi:hypothetical protein
MNRLPCQPGIAIAGQEGHAAGRDRGRHPVASAAARSRASGPPRRCACRCRSCGRRSPAASRSCARRAHVDLVAALRAVLAGPQLARHRVQRRALDVAVAQAPDLGRAPAGRRRGCRPAPCRRRRCAPPCRCGCPASARRPCARSGRPGHEQTGRGGEHDARAAVVLLDTLGCWLKITCTSVSRSPQPAARHRGAVAALARLGDRSSTGSWLSANFGSSTTSSRPHCRRHRSAAGRPAARRGRPSAPTMRSRPARSVTSMRPSGRKASGPGVGQTARHGDRLGFARLRGPGQRQATGQRGWERQSDHAGWVSKRC